MRWRRPPRKRGLGLTEEEVLGQLEKSEHSDTPFLWRYSPTQLLRMFERAGILARVEKLGYVSPRLTIRAEEGQHVLKLEVTGQEAPLMDLRLSEESRLMKGFASQRLGSEPLALLVIQWVSLQHVRGSFTAERPQLPGQSYPGLGAGRELYRLLWKVARGLGKDGLSAYPMYYHNAVYYSAGFYYLDPEKQGEFIALRRDLADLPLYVASEGINQGQLRHGATGEAVDWNSGEMFAAVSRRMRDYFASRDYRDHASTASSQLSFRLAPF